MKHIDEYDEEFWAIYRQQDTFLICALIAGAMILLSICACFIFVVKDRAILIGAGVIGAMIGWAVCAVQYHRLYIESVKAEEELFRRAYGEDEI